jgi:uncharacterized membrane protein YbhN (UPF0104 family)
MRRSWRYAASWAVTLLLLGWILYRVPWSEVWSHLGQVRVWPLLLAGALSLLGNAWLTCEKYRLILRGLGIRMRLWEVVLMKLGSVPLKNVLPLKSGEIVRLVYLRRIHGVSYLKGGASVIVNLVCTLVGLGLLMLPGYVALMDERVAWVLAGLLGAVTLLAMGMRGEGKEAEQARRPRDGERILARGLKGAWQVAAELRPMGLARVLGYSISFEGIKAINYGLIFMAMGISVPWAQLSRSIPPLILLSSLPISVMGLGIREGGVLLAFSETTSEANLVSAGLWVSVVEGLVPLMAGLALLRPFLHSLLSGAGRRGEEEAQ